MNYLKDFIRILSGNFDNHEQFKEMQNNGAVSFPFAKHINTVCNDKIMDLPQNFEGYFLLEESYLQMLHILRNMMKIYWNMPKKMSLSHPV